MQRRTIAFILILTSLSSCVSSNIFNELDTKYNQLKSDYDNLSLLNEDLIINKNGLETELINLQKTCDDINSNKNEINSELEILKKNYENLFSAYSALEKNSTKSLEENAKKNRALLDEINEKEEALALENKRLMDLETYMQERAIRITELENLIAAKDKAMRDLKDAISKALTAFEGKGLIVEQRNGKVYVSLENKLLFKSGSWSVGKQGRQAIIELGKVLGENPKIAVLIEGHTDNVSFSGNDQISNNWDLSTKRATAIISILSENSSIKLENLTAAGRSEYSPINSNETVEGKAKNRRIEVILTPKLDEISKLLNSK
tara:strand:- start:221 stop:1180 length:960 start_codon:yes stop_codon:yes gene_type:complete